MVKVKKAWYAPQALVVSRMRDTIPTYETVRGLQFKYFTLADDGKFGGIYLWKDQASAKTWFSDAWFARVLSERGAPGEVVYYDAPVVLDNVAAGRARLPDDGAAISTVVTIPKPRGATREFIIDQFKKSIPQYEQVPGLLRKYYILSNDGRFGGVYLWADRASAERFYDAAWRERVKATYAAEANVEYFAAPLFAKSRAPE